MEEQQALPAYLVQMVRFALATNSQVLHYAWHVEGRRKWYAYCGSCDQGGWFLYQETAVQKLALHAATHVCTSTPSTSRVPTMG